MHKTVLAAVLWATMAQAGWTLTVEEQILTGLHDQGFTVLEKGYTFLGRLRIVAESDNVHRELVVNPGTGEILRDYAVYLTDLPGAKPDVQAYGGGSAAADHASSGQPGLASDPAVGVASAAAAATLMADGSHRLGPDRVQVDTPPTARDVMVESALLTLAPLKP